MILNCPECSTRFLVNDKAIGATGRRVKCARCKTIWFQDPPKKEDLALDVDLPELDEIPESVKPIPEGSNLPVISNRYSLSFLYVTGMTLSTVLIFMVILTMFHGPITKSWEASAMLFETIGIDVPVLAEELVIEEAKFVEHVDEQGRTYVMFNAFLRNKSQEDVSVPPMMVTLYGPAISGHEVLGQYELDLDFSKLPAGQSQKIRNQFQVRQPGVADANVTFIEKNEQAKEIPHPYLDDVKLQNPDDLELKSAF